MNYMKKVWNSFIYTLSIILIGTLIITILNYFSFFNSKISAVAKIIVSLLGMLIGGLRIGKSSTKRGWIEGLKYGLIVCCFCLIFSLFLSDFKTRTLLFYLILIVTSIGGSMIGINKKFDNKK